MELTLFGVLYIILVLFSHPVQAGLVIVNTGNEYYAVKIWEGELPTGTQELVGVNFPNKTNKFVLIKWDYTKFVIPYPPGGNLVKPLNDMIIQLQKEGVLAVFYVSNFTKNTIGGKNLLLDPYGVSIPMIEVVKDANFLLQLLLNSNNASVMVNITTDPNPWSNYYHSPLRYIYQIFFIIYFSTIFILCFVLLLLIIKADLCEINLSVICLLLEAASNGLKILQFVVSPLCWNEIFFLPSGWIINSVHYPFFVATEILLILFWLDVTSKRLHVSRKMLGLFQIPGIVVIILLFCMEISIDITQSIVPFGNYVVIAVTIYVTVGFIASVCYLSVGFRLYYYQKNIKRKKALFSVLMKVLTSGVATIIVTILGLSYLFITNTPLAYTTIWGFIWLFLGITSISQILIFGTPKKSLKSVNSQKITHSSDVIVRTTE